jgi:hypothetical protein
MTATPPQTSGLHITLVTAGLLVLAGGLYAFYPRQADLRVFDSAAMARAETLMWRHYYEKRYLPLFADLYGVARDRQGFSPADSVRIAFLAARAAKRFQPSRSRAEADAALPDLLDYYAVLARAAPVHVDVDKAAHSELDWWQARREKVAPDDYGPVAARVSTLLYGVDVDNAKIRRSGVLRARAMAYRDAHGVAMTEVDWAEIAGQLDASYRLLKQAIAVNSR